MSRSVKNIIMISLVLVLGIGMFMSLNYLKNNTKLDNNTNYVGGMMDKQNGYSNNQRNNQMNGEPNFDNGDMEMPDMPDGEEGMHRRNAETDENAPNGNSSNDRRMKMNNTSLQVEEVKKDMVNDNMPIEQGNNQMREENNNDNKTFTYVIMVAFSVIIAVIVLYLLLSEFNKRSFKETFETKERVIIAIMGFIMALSLTMSYDIYIYNEVLKSDNNMEIAQVDESNNFNEPPEFNDEMNELDNTSIEM